MQKLPGAVLILPLSSETISAEPWDSREPAGFFHPDRNKVGELQCGTRNKHAQAHGKLVDPNQPADTCHSFMVTLSPDSDISDPQ